MDEDWTDLLKRLSTSDKVASRLSIGNGLQILVLSLAGLPQNITTVILHRKLCDTTSDDMPSCSKSVTEYFVLNLSDSTDREFRIPIKSSDAFMIEDWALKGCTKSVSDSQSKLPSSRYFDLLAQSVRFSHTDTDEIQLELEVYRCDADLTGELVKGFRKFAHETGRKAIQSALSTTLTDSLIVSIQPSTCRSVEVFWECLNASSHRATPPAIAIHMTSIGWIIHLIETNDTVHNFASDFFRTPCGSEWFVLAQPMISQDQRPITCAGSLRLCSLTSGHKFRLTVCQVHNKKQDGLIYSIRGERLVHQFRAEHTKEELNLLLVKARAIRQFPNSSVDNYLQCKWLYRHKPSEYYDDIMTNHGGVMEPYIKDNNGDPASCINGQLNGLFFSANVNFHTGKPMSWPIFGKTRLQLSCTSLLQNARLYFADFYCVTGSGRHHVTLVLTKKGSKADEFCCRKLVKLSLQNRLENPFLFLSEGKAYVSTNIYVEVLYTESVDIPDYIHTRLGKLKIIAEGFKTDHLHRHGGRSKRLGCRECNI